MHQFSVISASIAVNRYNGGDDDDDSDDED